MAKKKRKKKRKTKKRTVKRTNPGPKRKRNCRKTNPVTLARTLIGKVAEPGSTFSLTALKSGLKKAGYRNVKGWFDEMIKDAVSKRLLTPVSKSIYAFTPAAANPRGLRRKRKAKKRK
jgi:hypothetical protein